MQRINDKQVKRRPETISPPRFVVHPQLFVPAPPSPAGPPNRIFVAGPEWKGEGDVHQRTTGSTRAEGCNDPSRIPRLSSRLP